MAIRWFGIARQSRVTAAADRSAALIRLWLLILCGLLIPAPATVHAAGAGVTVFRQAQDRVYLLLADHRIHARRGWAGFGGRLDGQTPAEAAAREAHEESRGMISEHFLRARIEQIEPVISGGFSTWFIEIDWPGLVDAMNQLAAPTPAMKYQERGPYAWVPLDRVVAAIAERDERGRYRLPAEWLPSGSATDYLFDDFVTSLRRGLDAQALPVVVPARSGPGR